MAKKKRSKEEEEKPKTFKDSEMYKLGKDIAIAGFILFIVVGLLYSYTGNWPPVVVVESGSMMHDEDSHIGIIDTGDMVLVKKVDGRDDITTYVEGRADDYERYGDFGDVIIYRKGGNEDYTPIIHRALFWVEVNTTALDPADWTIAVPELGIGPRSKLDLPEYGISNYKASDAMHSGYITRGDNNYIQGQPVADQDPQRPISKTPVKMDWVVGVAKGEIPWFGLIKLKITKTLPDDAPRNSWMWLGITLFLLIGVPLLFDVFEMVTGRKKVGFIQSIKKFLFGDKRG